MTRVEKFRRARIEKRKRLLRKVRSFFLVFVVSLLLLSISAVIFIFYSPYTKLKELYVTTAMTTMSHQYLARIFLSDDEINSIMEKNKIKEPVENTDRSEIDIKTGQGENKSRDEKKSEEIELVNISGATFKGYMLIVKDPSRVSVGTSKSIGKVGMMVKDIVKRYDAVGGINAGGFADENGTGTGGTPQGILIEDGEVVFVSSYGKHSIIGFDKNNVLVLGNYTYDEIMELGLRDAVSFKPFLVVNGKPVIKHGDGGWGIAPRTAIGQRKDGTVLMLVIDGRQIGSIGATLKDVQDIMLEYGAHNAANLDGGSSTTLCYNGKIVNNPCSIYGPRHVPSAFIIK